LTLTSPVLTDYLFKFDFRIALPVDGGFPPDPLAPPVENPTITRFLFLGFIDVKLSSRVIGPLSVLSLESMPFDADEKPVDRIWFIENSLDLDIALDFDTRSDGLIQR
jgi:hypothetical protein